jgi:hypothetical protein
MLFNINTFIDILDFGMSLGNKFDMSMYNNNEEWNSRKEQTSSEERRIGFQKFVRRYES